MLLVHDHPVDSAEQGQNLLRRILALPGIPATVDKFLSRRPSADQFADRKSIFVMQRELALVDESKEPKCILSSSEATTCVIGVAICKESKRAAICHFDNGRSAFVTQWLAGMSQPAVYLVGGYEGDKGLGPSIASKILTHLHTSDTLTVALALVCLGNLNTQPDGSPKCCDLMVDIANGMAYPCGFKHGAPVLLERHGRFYCSNENTLRQVYNAATQRIVFEGYDAHLDWITKHYFKRLLVLPDDLFIQSTSTSPAHEGPQFIPNLRRLFEWLLKLPSEASKLATQEYAWCSTDHTWKLAPA